MTKAEAVLAGWALLVVLAATLALLIARGRS